MMATIGSGLRRGCSLLLLAASLLCGSDAVRAAEEDDLSTGPSRIAINGVGISGITAIVQLKPEYTSSRLGSPSWPRA